MPPRSGGQRSTLLIPPGEEGATWAQRRGLHFSLEKGEVRESFLEEGTVIPDQPIILDISWGLRRGPSGEGPSMTPRKFHLHPVHRCAGVRVNTHTHTHTHSAWPGSFCSTWGRKKVKRGRGGEKI